MTRAKTKMSSRKERRDGKTSVSFGNSCFSRGKRRKVCTTSFRRGQLPKAKTEGLQGVKAPKPRDGRRGATKVGN
jgi:hypothetical protein